MFDSPLVRKGLLPALVFLTLAGGKLMAQPLGGDSGPRSNQVNSPYSRYGIGNLNAPYSTDYRGMGGTAAAATPGLNINSFNPASYSFLTAATLDFALEANRRSVFLGDNKTNSGTGNFGYLNLGMNIGNHFGLNIGFKPISNMYYNATDTENIQGLGTTLKNFNGSGNLQYAFIGLAGQYKGLSLGANFGYAFGTFDYSNSMHTSGSDTSGTVQHHVRSAQFTKNDALGGIYWNAGLMYHAKLKKEKYFNIGLTATLSQDLKINRQSYTIAYNYLIDGTTADLVSDTMNRISSKETLTLPASYTFGLAFGKAAKWDLAADFNYTDWSVFSNAGDRQGVGDNSWRASIGGSFIPGATSADKKYLSFVTYRLGAYYGKDYFNLFQTDVNYFGGTIGASFPLQRNYNNFGKINLSLDVGQRGTIQNGLAKEVYLNFTFGISLNDTYWLKRPAHYQ